MIALLWFLLTLFASPLTSKSRLEAENAALRYQLIVLRRKAEGGRSRPPHQRRSLVLYPAVSMVSVGAEGHHGHPCRDARPLASGRLSSLLVLEVAPVWRAAADQRGAARLDPANEHREPALGSTAYPRRIAQARV